MGRRVWSDPEVRELASEFVPAADEVWRLQNDPDPECVFFREHVLGKPDPTKGTLQGTYVFSPSGKLLGRRNSNDPKAVLGFLKEMLVAWEGLDDSERKLEDPARVAQGFRWEDLYPEDGLVLRRTGRDLPASGNPTSEQSERFNRDAVWFSPSEMKQLVPPRLQGGSEHVLPAELARRMSCLVFVDNLRGQTIPYHPTEDGGSTITMTVTAVSEDQVQLVIRGETKAASDGTWKFEPETDWVPPEKARWPHSIQTKLFGRAVYDKATKRFREFTILALGTRTGRTINNGRPTQGPSGVGFYCEIAPEDWRVAPTFIDVYGEGWARKD